MAEKSEEQSAALDDPKLGPQRLAAAALRGDSGPALSFSEPQGSLGKNLPGKVLRIGFKKS